MGLGFVIGFLSGMNLGFIASLFVMISTWVSLFVGGFWAGWRAPKSKVVHGLLAGMVCLNLSLPINAAMGLQDQITLPVVIVAMINNSMFGALGGFYANKMDMILRQNSNHSRTGHRGADEL
jgi:putative membrane protein (TIGR04086 family)